MTDGIGRLSGYGNYGVGGYIPQRKGTLPQNNEEQQGTVANYGQSQQPVDPNRVMDLLANNNIYVGPTKAEKPQFVELDPETKDRIAASMEDFQRFYETAAAEVGPELALAVTDAYLER